jgi:DNA-binding transcriptional LysR family regulator
MTRNIDITALRSFVAIIDAGGVTRAAGFLNLTQSAVSMQIKRLEDLLNLPLFDRSTRKMAPTPAGEQLLGYARKMLALNDEVFGRLTEAQHEGEIILGVPHDIVYPTIPPVLKAFAVDFPKMRITLVSSFTKTLKAQFAQGECDLILTTESTLDADGETMAELPLVWLGAVGGAAWKQRPLRLAFEDRCFFRAGVQAALDGAGIAWNMAVAGASTRAIEASVSADLAVHAVLLGSEPPYAERIQHGGALPDLGGVKINMYVASTVHSPAITALAAMIRQGYAMRSLRAVA